MSGPGDAAAKQLDEERERVEISPAQPDDASRIDGGAPDAEISNAPAAVKHDHSGRMQH
jgi:hypothetical protein